MNMIEIIFKKTRGSILSKQEIDFFRKWIYKRGDTGLSGICALNGDAFFKKIENEETFC